MELNIKINNSKPIDWEQEYKKLKQLIPILLSSERQRLIDQTQQETLEWCEKVADKKKKDTSVLKQAKVALKFDDKYSLNDIRNIVKGYNKALEELRQTIKQRKEGL
jgi:Mg2+/Co2+ transporter CorC